MVSFKNKKYPLFSLFFSHFHLDHFFNIENIFFPIYFVSLKIDRETFSNPMKGVSKLLEKYEMEK